MNFSYKVSLVSQNLHKNETIIQVADALQSLSQITDDILKRVDNRLNSCNQKVSNISSRVDIVEAKITKLKGAKNATQVFSSCKYPATNIEKQYKSIFENIQPIEVVKHKVKNKNFSGRGEPLEKLQVYHVRQRKNQQDKKIHGIGDIPKDIKCINDVLLYNSGKNLYKNFVMSDSLQVTHQPVKLEEDTARIGLAPVSISDRSSFSDISNQTYFYTPNLGEVPTLDVPLDLPDLPGIADNLRYENDNTMGIAPSVVSTPITADAPSIPIVDIPTELENLPEVVVSPRVTTPEPIQIQKQEEPKIKVEQAVNETSSIQVQNEFHQLPPVIDARASLMEAIRKAGGSKKAKLKSSENQVEEPSKQQHGGDLMADLHSKLAMRRKGISGSKKTNLEENQFDAATALSRISQLIPPPTEEIKFKDTEDEDWD